MSATVEGDSSDLPVPDFGGRLPLTNHGATFVKRHRTVLNFFLFGVRLASTADENRRIAIKALAGSGGEDDAQRLADLEAEGDVGPTLKQLSRFAEYQSETICIRHVDNFQCFLSDLIQACMHKKPDILRHGDPSVRVDEILDFTRFGDLQKYLVDKRLSELTYAGIEKVHSFAANNLGLQLTETEEELSLLKISIQLRNIYTHNRGRIDQLFLSRVGNSGFIDVTLGKRYHANFDTLCTLANNLVRIGERLDRSAADKFGLRKKKLDLWSE